MGITTAFIISVIAGLSTPWVARNLLNLWNHLFGDTPRIEGHWIATFKSPQIEDKTAEWTERNVQVEFRKFGRRLFGKGRLVENPQDLFIYKAEVKRNSITGSFERKKGHMLAGTGVFQLKVSADEKTMFGSCSWYNKIIDDVGTSSYSWQKIK